MCQHKNFHTDVIVTYIVDENTLELTNYRADFKIKCSDCGLPFEFMCGGLLNAGYAKSAPTMSPDNKEIRFPIIPTTDPVDHVNLFLDNKSIKNSTNE